MINEKSTRLEFLDYLISDEYKFVPLRENDVRLLNEELTGDELQDTAWDDREFLDLAPRVDEISWASYIKMDDRHTFRFQTEAVTTDTAYHQQRIRVLEMDELMADIPAEDLDGIKENLLTAIRAGNVEVWCDDASFKWWGFGYLVNQFDAGWFSGSAPDYMNIAPDERNPEGKRFLCKHLYRIISDIITDENFLDDMAMDVARKIRSGGRY